MIWDETLAMFAPCLPPPLTTALKDLPPDALREMRLSVHQPASAVKRACVQWMCSSPPVSWRKSAKPFPTTACTPALQRLRRDTSPFGADIGWVCAGRSTCGTACPY